MPSVKELQRQAMRKQPPENKIEKLAVLFSLLLVCDNYILTKTDGSLRIVVYKNIFNKEINAANEFEVAKQLGDWLMSLPKGVWDEGG